MVGTNTFIASGPPLDRRRLGKYEVLCRLSTGGMSAIYLAHQTGLGGFNKLVVLKTILPEIGNEEDFISMFLEEARITASFNHPNIAQVFELDTDVGQLFMAIEFVQGCTLVEMARACRQAKESIPIGFTLSATRDTALALQYAHNFIDPRGRRQIVIHRDVAEKNIMMTYEGITKLLDFGIAKALGRSGRTTIGTVKGTSGYMSPEQIRGDPLDARSDIFALGVVMHECLTGLRLFHGKTPKDGMLAALKEEAQPPSKWNPLVTPELDAVVLKALQRERDKRYGTALEFARAIEKAAPGRFWYPEQCGELVTKHFSERRLETARLLEEAELGSELGEDRVRSVVARLRAGANPPTELKIEPPPRPVLTAPPMVMIPRKDDESTRPVVLPHHLKNILPPQLPFSSPSPLPTPTDANVLLEGELELLRLQNQNMNTEEGSERTVPIRPDELRNLRAQFAKQQNAASGPPLLGPSSSPPTRREGAETIMPPPIIVSPPPNPPVRPVVNSSNSRNVRMPAGTLPPPVATPERVASKPIVTMFKPSETFRHTALIVVLLLLATAVVGIALVNMFHWLPK